MSKLSRLKLDKPVVVFDLETTGVDTANDRIVQIAYEILDENLKKVTSFEIKINPGVDIPKGASDVHGITNDMVKDAPPFKAIAHELYKAIVGKHLGGYNIINFDVPMLYNEFQRCGITYPTPDVKMIDSFKIFCLNNRRDLQSAHRYYTGKGFDDAHDALSDCTATSRILKRQLMMHDELPNDGDGIQDYAMQGKKIVDINNKVHMNEEGFVCFSFGKHRGEKVIDNKSYASWMVSSGFPKSTIDAIQSEIEKHKK